METLENITTYINIYVTYIYTLYVFLIEYDISNLILVILFVMAPRFTSLEGLELIRDIYRLQTVIGITAKMIVQVEFRQIHNFVNLAIRKRSP